MPLPAATIFQPWKTRLTPLFRQQPRAGPHAEAVSVDLHARAYFGLP
jgi:hypothetical protein